MPPIVWSRQRRHVWDTRSQGEATGIVAGEKRTTALVSTAVTALPHLRGEGSAHLPERFGSDPRWQAAGDLIDGCGREPRGRPKEDTLWSFFDSEPGPWRPIAGIANAFRKDDPALGRQASRVHK